MTVVRKREKVRYSLWIHEETLQKVRRFCEEDGAVTQSEFIEKAVLFYFGHLAADSNEQYISETVLSTLKGIVAQSDNRICRMLFKLAVELSMTMNVVAAGQEIDKVALERLRGECVKEVRRLNGTITFDDAYDWQKG